MIDGASQKSQMMIDLWVLDLSSMQWSQLHPKGEAPHIRCSHTAVLVGQSIVFHGGSYYRWALLQLHKLCKKAEASEAEMGNPQMMYLWPCVSVCVIRLDDRQE